MLKYIIILLIFEIDAQEHYSNETSTTNSSIPMRRNITRPKSDDPFAESVKDIAYYLRAHKFNEYDRRYETTPSSAPRSYYKHFPRPPLRSLHWEVRQYCEANFTTCVDYLAKKIKYTALRRTDDTSFVIQEQKWDRLKDTEQYKQVDRECEKMKKVDDTMADPFAGPLERFQWRTTASYYMCWYTMQETTELEHLGEPCDNFAACLDSAYGPNNEDIRANDTNPYACALYSFCPDTCCPFKHLKRLEDCWDEPENPCHRLNAPDQRTCSLNFSSNTGFEDLVLNRWNVSCNCPEKGYIWSSLYGFCIDVDECGTSETHNCDHKSEACLNLAGSFRCACKWGFVWNSKHKKCVLSAALELIKVDKSVEEKNKTLSFVQKVLKLFGKSDSCSVLLSNGGFLILLCFISTKIQFCEFNKV